MWPGLARNALMRPSEACAVEIGKGCKRPVKVSRGLLYFGHPALPALQPLGRVPPKPPGFVFAACAAALGRLLRFHAVKDRFKHLWGRARMGWEWCRPVQPGIKAPRPVR